MFSFLPLTPIPRRATRVVPAALLAAGLAVLLAPAGARGAAPAALQSVAPAPAGPDTAHDAAVLGTTPVRPPGGPAVRVHRQPGPLVAIRLSAPVGPGLPEGAVELLQELARDAAGESASAVGARVRFQHQPGRAVISVTGPVAAFDALAAVLRRAASELDLSVASLRRARARAEDRVLARLEQPEPRLRRQLWWLLAGGARPVGSAAAGLDPEAIRWVQRRLYGADAVTVTLVGDVPETLIRSAFARWPAAGAGGRPPGSDDAVEPARPQAHREWAGLGYPVTAEAAVLALAAELVQERLDRADLRRGTAEAWRVPGAGWALVVTGAAEPGDSVVAAVAGVGALPVRGEGPARGATGVGLYLRRTVAEAATLAGAGTVRGARERLRRRLLVSARTVSGRAEAIGGLTDALGPAGAADFLADLDRVTLDQVRALLEEVLAMPAIYVDAR